MACSLLFRSGFFPSPTIVGDGDHFSTRVVSCHQANSYRKTKADVSSLPLWKAGLWAISSPSRSTRAQATEETSSSYSSVAKTQEGSGAGGGGCLGCGRTEKLGGCNGEGRIQGGIGAVPGFGWWPIKAFRPCPAFLEKGGRYRRIGQSLEEVAFGRKGPGDDSDISERIKG